MAQLKVGAEDKLYDPSYGRVWDDIEALDNDGMDFYGQLLGKPRFLPNQDKAQVTIVLRQNNAGGVVTTDLKRLAKPTEYKGE